MPMSTVSAADAELISVLSSTNVGVLVPFRSEKFHHCQAMACCSDGFRVHMPEKFIELCRRHEVTQPIMFRYETHGIAMRFGLENPLSPDDIWWKGFLPQFEQAQRFTHGEIRQYNLVHHWPCGAATEEQIGFIESLVYVMMSKTRLKRCGPFHDVSMLLWIDRPNNEHEVFRIKKEPLLRYLEALPDQTLYQRWLRHEELLALEAPAVLQAA